MLFPAMDSQLFAVWSRALPLWRCACQPREEAAESWREWRAGNDLQGLAQRFLPAIWRNLSGHDSLQGDEVSLRSLHVNCWTRNMTLLEGGQKALTVLEQSRIPTLLLKGAAMLIRYYEDPGLRSMSDFDVLVPFQERLKALRALQQAGWQLAEPVRLPQLFAHHGCAMLHPGNPGFKIDLHWCALSECRWEGADRDFWTRAQPLRWRGAQTHLLSPDDAMIHLICHSARLSAYTSPWLLDVTRLFEEHGSAINWPQIIRETRLREVSPAVRAGLHFLRENLGWPLPPVILSHPVALSERAYFWGLQNQGSLRGGVILFLTDFLRTRRPKLDLRLPWELWQYVSPLWAVASPREALTELRRRWRRLAAR